MLAAPAKVRCKQPVKKLLIGCGAFAALAVVSLLVFVVVVGIYGPDAAVVPGPQLPTRFVSTIRDLGLLAAGEEIRLFYSDSLVDIRDGMYFLTDRKLVIYDDDFAEPAIVVPLTELEAIDVHYDDSFFADSEIQVTRDDGTETWFPVSNDQGGDKRFYEALREAWADAKGALPAEAPRAD